MNSSPDRAPLVRKVCFDKAKELHKALSPGGKYVEFNQREGQWCAFRGHSNADHKLVPSALRETSGGLVLHELSCNWPNSDAESDSNVLQLLREYTVLRRFFDVADQIGLPIPEDSQRARYELQRAHYAIVRARKKLEEGEDLEIGIKWPIESLLSLMGLAQHHGIPTRLLDWTRRADVAMFFSAAGKLRREDENQGSVSVWVLNLGLLDDWHHRQVIDQGRTAAHRPLEVVTAPRAGNPHLHAQSGFFTLLSAHMLSAGGKVDRRPLDEALAEYHDQLWCSQHNYPVFYHFVLPSSECRELLWLLERGGTTPAALFPSFDGVKKDIEHSAKMRAAWDTVSHTSRLSAIETHMSVVQKDASTGFGFSRGGP